MKITHLFFDLDRTLWDFEKNSQIALTQLYNDLGLTRFTKHYLQFFNQYQSINKELWVLYGKNKITKEELRDRRFIQTFEALGIHDVALAKKMAQGYLDISPNQTALFPGTMETLSALKDAGYHLNIITNGFKEVQLHKIINSRLAPFFEEVICSDEIGVQKPDRRVFDEAIRRADADRRTSVMIGDDMKADVLGAEAAEIQAVLFDPNVKRRYDNEIRRIENLEELPMLLLKM